MIVPISMEDYVLDYVVLCISHGLKKKIKSMELFKISVNLNLILIWKLPQSELLSLVEQVGDSFYLFLNTSIAMNSSFQEI